MSKYDDFIEVEHPSEVTGTLMADEGVPYLFVDHVGYDVTVADGVSMTELMSAIGSEVTLRVDRMSRAGMVAPQLGHIVVSGLALSDLKVAP